MENQKNEVCSTNRNNNLSLKKTSNVIKVHYSNEIRVYDNIHFPEAYINKLKLDGRNPIIAVELNGSYIDLKNR
jgi:hypothetical protein